MVSDCAIELSVNYNTMSAVHVVYVYDLIRATTRANLQIVQTAGTDDRLQPVALLLYAHYEVQGDLLYLQ